MPSPFNNTTSQNINSMSGGPLSSMGLTALDSLGGYKMPEFNTPNMGGGLQSSNQAFQAASATNPFSTGAVGGVGGGAASSIGGGANALNQAASKLSQAASALQQAASRLGGGGVGGTMQMPGALSSMGGGARPSFGGGGGGTGPGAQEELAQQAALINRGAVNPGAGEGARGKSTGMRLLNAAGGGFESFFNETANAALANPVLFAVGVAMKSATATAIGTRTFNQMYNAQNIQSALRATPFYSGNNANALDALQAAGNKTQALEFPGFQTAAMIGMRNIGDDSTFIDLLQPGDQYRAGQNGNFNVLGFMANELGLGPSSAMGQIRDVIGNQGFRELRQPSGMTIDLQRERATQSANGAFNVVVRPGAVGGQIVGAGFAKGVSIQQLANFQTEGLSPTQIGRAFSGNLASSNLQNVFGLDQSGGREAGRRILRNVNALGLTGSAADALINNFLQLGNQSATFGFEIGEQMGAGQLGLIARMQNQDTFQIFKDQAAPSAAGRIDLKMGKGAVQAFQQNFAGIGSRVLMAHAIREAGVGGAQNFLEQLSPQAARDILVNRMGKRRAGFAMSGMNLSIPEQRILDSDEFGGDDVLSERAPGKAGKKQFAVRRTMAQSDLNQVKDVMDTQLGELQKLVKLNSAMEKSLRNKASVQGAIDTMNAPFFNDLIKTINSVLPSGLQIPTIQVGALPGNQAAPASGPTP